MKKIKENMSRRAQRNNRVRVSHDVRTSSYQNKETKNASIREAKRHEQRRTTMRSK